MEGGAGSRICSVGVHLWLLLSSVVVYMPKQGILQHVLCIGLWLVALRGRPASTCRYHVLRTAYCAEKRGRDNNHPPSNRLLLPTGGSLRLTEGKRKKKTKEKN